MASSSLMPFRDDTIPSPNAADPLARFQALYAAFDAERGFFGDRVPLRLAAVTLLTVPGDVVQLVARVRATDAELAPHYGWTSSVDRSLRNTRCRLVWPHLGRAGLAPAGLGYSVSRTHR